MLAGLTFLFMSFMSVGSDSSTEVTQVYSLQSAEDPSSFYIFFSTHDHFRRIGVTKALYFLTSDGSPEYYHRFNISDVICLSNSSYCYTKGSLPYKVPSPQKPAICQWLVTVRGNVLDSGDTCEFAVCPNMETTDDCPLVVHSEHCPHTTCWSDRCKLPRELIDFQPLPKCANSSGTGTSTVYNPPVSIAYFRGDIFGYLSLALACLSLVGIAIYAVVHWYFTPRPIIYISINQLDDLSMFVDDTEKLLKAKLRLSLLPIPTKNDAEKIIGELQYSLQSNAGLAPRRDPADIV